ncbi:MAG TPA: short-chain dehydrogenase [Clostridiales bacterium]|nr:short-chain dehydrogenase [Clostridiales bacterium]
MNLQGKAVLLTGADAGIGRAAAHRFAREGARVCVTGRREAAGRKIVEELVQISGEKDSVLFVQGDISIKADSIRMIDETVKKFGKLDILVNCAAAQLGGTVLDAEPEDYQKIFNTNVMGYGLCAKAAIPYLNQSTGSAIVNIASLNGNIGTPGRMLYDASKAAVIEMTQCMAIDFPSIRVNCVSPGFTRSDAMMQGLSMTGLDPEECAALISKGTIMKRMAAPEEIANVIVFLASDEASFMTGANIIVDGGALSYGNYGAALENDPRLTHK